MSLGPLIFQCFYTCFNCLSCFWAMFLRPLISQCFDACLNYLSQRFSVSLRPVLGILNISVFWNIKTAFQRDSTLIWLLFLKDVLIFCQSWTRSDYPTNTAYNYSTVLHDHGNYFVFVRVVHKERESQQISFHLEDGDRRNSANRSV